MECGLKSRVIRDYDIFIGNKRVQSRARASKFTRGVKFQLRRFVRNFPPCKTRSSSESDLSASREKRHKSRASGGTFRKTKLFITNVNYPFKVPSFSRIKGIRVLPADLFFESFDYDSYQHLWRSYNGRRGKLIVAFPLPLRATLLSLSFYEPCVKLSLGISCGCKGSGNSAASQFLSSDYLNVSR